MQHNTKTLGEKCYLAITGSVWVVGLLISGSDNICMPWINAIGLVLFLISSILLGKFLRPTESGSKVVIFPKFYQAQSCQSQSYQGPTYLTGATKHQKAVKKNCRINIRYAAQIR